MQGNDYQLGQAVEAALRIAKERQFSLPLRVVVQDGFGETIEMVGDENGMGGFRFHPVRISTKVPLVPPMTVTISEADGDQEFDLRVTGPDLPRT